MINKIYIGFLYLFSIICSAQGNNEGLRVEYKLFCDTDVPIKVSNILSIYNNVAIYQQKLSTTERWTEKPSEYEIDLSRIQSSYEPYMKIDRKNKQVLFFDAIGQNTFLIKDNYIDHKWNISNETKVISNYTCNKATTTFRGREWIVWFTPEIAVPYGPWKLHGLPGLILEASDATNRYTFKAIKIENVKDEIFNKDFETLMDIRTKKPMHIKEFIEKRKEYSDNRIKEIMGNKEVITKVKEEPRKGEELIYEWEQQ